MSISANIRDISQAYPRMLVKSSLEEHIKEQVLYRATRCIDCTQLTYCKICKCATPAIYYAPNREDKEHKWGPFLSVNTWTEFKETREYKDLIKSEDYKDARTILKL